MGSAWCAEYSTPGRSEGGQHGFWQRRRRRRASVAYTTDGNQTEVDSDSESTSSLMHPYAGQSSSLRRPFSSRRSSSSRRPSSSLHRSPLLMQVLFLLTQVAPPPLHDHPLTSARSTSLLVPITSGHHVHVSQCQDGNFRTTAFLIMPCYFCGYVTLNPMQTPWRHHFQGIVLMRQNTF